MPPQDANPTPSFGGFGLSGSSPLLDAYERVEFAVGLADLATALTTSTQFRIEIKPQVGATLVVERTTPAEMKAVVNLQ